MKILNKKTIFTSLVLIIIFCLSFLLPSILNIKQNISTRNINVNEIGTLSYEDTADKLKEQFNTINTNEDESYYYFNGEIDIEQYDLLSTSYEGHDLKEKYSSAINKSTESIKIEKDVILNNEVVSTISENYMTKYDEQAEKYYLIDENGNEIDIFEQLEYNNVNECLALTISLISLSLKEIVTICVVTAISIVFIENADSIENDINTLVEGVKDGFVSFWDRIKLKLGKITAIALKSIIGVFTISQATKIFKQAKNRKDCYLLLGPVSSTEPIGIVYKFTNKQNAINWIKKGGSIWSPYATTTKEAIKGAGYLAGGTTGKNIYVANIVEHHNSLIGLPTFDHYHTIIGSTRVNYSCHGFFGLPYIS